MGKKNRTPPDGTEGQKFSQELEVKLTDDEITKRKDRIVELCCEIDDVQAKKDSAAAGFNQELKALRKERSSLIDTVKTGATKQQVECFERFIVATNTVEIVRTDTGAVVDKRAMEGHERDELTQGKLFKGNGAVDEQPAEPASNVARFPPGAKPPAAASQPSPGADAS